MILHKEERSGSGVSTSVAQEFTDAMDRLELVDILLRGGQWTWSN